MAPVINLLAMLEVGRTPKHGVVPVKVPRPLVDMRVPITDGPGIALEVTVINRVEAYDRRVEPDVCTRQSVRPKDDSHRASKIVHTREIFPPNLVR